MSQFIQKQSSGGGGDPTIGNPIINANPWEVLFADGSGDLAQSSDFVFSDDSFLASRPTTSTDGVGLFSVGDIVIPSTGTLVGTQASYTFEAPGGDVYNSGIIFADAAPFGNIPVTQFSLNNTTTDETLRLQMIDTSPIGGGMEMFVGHAAPTTGDETGMVVRDSGTFFKFEDDTVLILPTNSGTDGYVLTMFNSTTGQARWLPASGGTPGGVLGSVQYNDGIGGFEGDKAFIYGPKGNLTLGDESNTPSIPGLLTLKDIAGNKGNLSFNNGTDFTLEPIGSGTAFLIADVASEFGIKPMDTPSAAAPLMTLRGADFTGTAGQDGGSIIIQPGTTSATSSANTGDISILGGEVITDESSVGKFLIKGSSVATGIANKAGGRVVIEGGTSTGDQTGGDIRFLVTPAGASGSTQNGSILPLIIDGNGNLMFDGYQLNQVSFGEASSITFASTVGAESGLVEILPQSNAFTVTDGVDTTALVQTKDVFNWSNIKAFDDDADAGAGGLTTGDMYQTTGSGAAPLNVAGIMMIKQ